MSFYIRDNKGRIIKVWEDSKKSLLDTVPHQHQFLFKKNLSKVEDLNKRNFQDQKKSQQDQSKADRIRNLENETKALKEELLSIKQQLKDIKEQSLKENISSFSKSITTSSLNHQNRKPKPNKNKQMLSVFQQIIDKNIALRKEV